MTNPADLTRGGGAAGDFEAGVSTIPQVADTWPDVYASARRWVCWTARRRWPTFAANDDIWAASVADWWVGGRDG